MNDSLGDRMKRYEIVPRICLTIKTPVIIRLDGKAFHTFTKRFDSPFDNRMSESMLQAAGATAKKMQGFKLGFTASDEVSFYLSDFDNIETSPWFGYDVQKIVSIASAYMSVYFNDFVGIAVPASYLSQDIVQEIADKRMRSPEKEYATGCPPVFDGRVFNVPFQDVPNYFLWRQKDWIRNSVSAYASMFFSHKELQGKSSQQRHELLHSIGKNWAKDLPDHFKNGTYFTKEQAYSNISIPTYETLENLITLAHNVVGVE